jgi:hypothetical protein
MNKLFCFIFGHQFILKETITTDVVLLICDKCKQEFTKSDNFSGPFLMDKDFRNIHTLMRELKIKNNNGKMPKMQR